jgi:nitrite reductase/ring-hydroxylating ferredoxin subunit
MAARIAWLNGGVPQMMQPKAGRIANVPFQITDPERIPARRYYDEEFYKLECERLWPHVWQMACRLEQIPNIGDWVEYRILDQSVIIVRTQSGVKAFHNACRHRGMQLVSGHGNCKLQGFICPFHGWRWNMDGSNAFVYGRHLFSEKQLDKAHLALRPCRLELWGGCAFINFDDAAAALRECMGPLANRLEAHGMSNLHAEWWYATVLPANWKIAMEAFMEGYHVMRTHPQLYRTTPSLYNAMYGQDTGGIAQAANPNRTVRENIERQVESLRLLSEGMAGMIHEKEVAIARELLDVPLPADPVQALPAWVGILRDQITQQLRARGEPVPDLNAVAVSDPVNAVEFLFPHCFLLAPFSSMSAYRVRPLGPESCLFELWSLTHVPEGTASSPPMEPTMLPYDSPSFPPIPQQDYSNIPRQQRGLHTQGFEYMRLSSEKEGLISNYQRIIDGYLAQVAPEKLARATRMLGGNFDGKILELGFSI